MFFVCCFILFVLDCGVWVELVVVLLLRPFVGIVFVVCGWWSQVSGLGVVVCEQLVVCC